MTETKLEHTQRELLYLAGKLAMTCQELRGCRACDLGECITRMSIALNNYNDAILENEE